jgi:hypothetical protein
VSAFSLGLMAMNLPLSRMGLQEKLVAMELLWADLSATPDQVVSPAWHGEECVADGRFTSAKNGGCVPAVAPHRTHTQECGRCPAQHHHPR